MANNYEIPSTPATKNDSVRITGVELKTFPKEWEKENNSEKEPIVITGSVEVKINMEILSTELKEGQIIKLSLEGPELSNEQKNIKSQNGGKSDDIDRAG